MKNILYDLRTIRPQVTGIGRYVIELIQYGLSSQAAQRVTALSARRELSGDDLLERLHELDTLEKPLRRDSPIKALIDAAPGDYQLYRKIKNAPVPRRVLAHSSEERIYHNTSYNFIDIPGDTILTVHDLSHLRFPKDQPRRRSALLDHHLEQAIHGAAHVLTVSETIRDEILDEYGVPEDRVSVTRLAAHERFHPRKQEECAETLEKYQLGYKRYLLCVGSFERRKNISRIINAHYNLPDAIKAEYPIVIAGPDSWVSSDLSTKFDDPRYRKTLRNIGYVPRNELPHLFSAARAFVYPSLYEGFGLPIIEGFASGCPVITSNYGAMAEVSGGAAYEVSPDDTEQITHAMQQTIESNSLQSELSDKGVARAARFSWQNMGEETFRIYNSV